MSTSQKSLKAEARKYLSLPDLFPKGAPDLRKKLSEYQVKKIRRALGEIQQQGGRYFGDFVPIGRGRKKFQQSQGLPTYFKGTFLPGGEKKNSGVEFIGGGLLYVKDGAERVRFEINTTSEDTVKISVRAIWQEKNKGTRAAITAAGRVIGSAQGMTDLRTLTTQALYIWNKYTLAADNGEMRQVKAWGLKPDGTPYFVPAAHPGTWPMGVLFEAPPKKKAPNSGKGKNATTKKAAPKKAGKGRARK